MDCKNNILFLRNDCATFFNQKVNHRLFSLLLPSELNTAI